MSKSDNDLFEVIKEHQDNITNSFLFYRTQAKLHKINVLNAACQYLAGEIDKNELLIVIRRNKQYADSFFKSQTREIIEKVLGEKQAIHRTKEGYFKMR